MKNIFIVPTDKPSRLVRIYNDAERKNFTIRLDGEVNDSFKEYVNVYIVNDEEIKKSDWCYLNKDGREFIYKCKEKPENPKRWGLKIILSTNSELISDDVQAIDDTFLEWFCENSSCEFVEVKKGFEDGSAYGYNFLDYKIIIPKTTQKIIDEDFAGGQIIPNEEPTFIDSLKEYFDNTSEEQIQKDWDETEKYDQVGYTIDEFLEAQKQLPKESVIQTKEDADIFYKELENPSEPNEKLKKAIRKQEKRSKLNLTQLSKDVDDVLDKETKESMSQWLKEKRQQESFEEELSNFIKPIKYPTLLECAEFGANWQAERMYSEEEVYSLLHNLMSSVSLGLLKINDDMDLKAWFNKNKK